MSTTSFAFAFHGLTAQVEWDEDNQDFSQLMLPVFTPVATGQARFVVCGDEIIGPDGDSVRARRIDRLEALERSLHFHLANHCPEVVFVHAGVVAWQGRALILPGSSFAGKSTLVHQLTLAGAGYLSDEYAIIDRQGLIHPFPRPISLREPLQRVMPPDPLLEPVPLGAVFSTRYSPDEPWNPIELSGASGVLEMLAHTVTARTQPELAMHCLAQGVSQARCWRTPRAEAAEAAQRILQCLS
jgi:hypothetical protein